MLTRCAAGAATRRQRTPFQCSIRPPDGVQPAAQASVMVTAAIAVIPDLSGTAALGTCRQVRAGAC